MSREILTVGELRGMLDGVDDGLKVYLQTVVTPLGSHDYVSGVGAEVAVGVPDGSNTSVNFPAVEDFDAGVYDTDDGNEYFLIFP